MTTIESVSKTCIDILLSEPFYGHFMMGVPREITQKVDTAAVTLMSNHLIKLVVNEDFWNILNEEQRYGVIKHEVLHIVLKHLFTLQKYSNKQLFNIAADIVVNQYVEPKQLIEGAVTLERFKHYEKTHKIKLERDKDVGYYYEQLNIVLKQTPATGNYAVGVGGFGGGDGNDSDLGGGGQGDGSSKQEDISDLSDLLENSNEALDRHKFWEKFEKLSEAERKVAEFQANSMIKQTVNRVRNKTRNYGNLPAGLIQMLEQVLQDMKPQFNWRRVLRLFATSSNSTYLKNTIRRSSKRYGTTPGIKVKRKNKLLLAIDTSGSIQMDELLEFFSEIYFIWRQGAEITVVECDVSIHSIYKYRGVPPEAVKGGGGTSFEAPIQYGNEELRPDALIYFTDGHAQIPETPPRFPILWVISSNGMEEGCTVWEGLPGKKLKLS